MRLRKRKDSLASFRLEYEVMETERQDRRMWRWIARWGKRNEPRA